MDNELKLVDIKCDYKSMPTRYRKITLPASIMRIVRYRHLHIQSSKIENLEAIVAYFLTNDQRYCEYFEVIDESVSQAEDSKEETEKETELQTVELPEPAPKELKQDEQKEPAKKQTAKKKPAKRRARKPKAKKEDSNNG